MRKTKIVCTLGPACANEKTLEEMLRGGMNVARFNFSHGTHEYHKQMIDMFRSVRDRLGLPAAIMLDTKGPEIRVGDFENGKVTLRRGDSFVLTSREVMGNESCVHMSFPLLPHQVHEGIRILMDDGKVSMTVKSTTDTDIVCTVENGGVLSNHKSINIPNFHIDMPYISERD